MGSKIQVTAGNVKIGGGAKVSVQSMLNIPSTDIEGSVRQAKELEEAGCEIIRAAIPKQIFTEITPYEYNDTAQTDIMHKGCLFWR